MRSRDVQEGDNIIYGRDVERRMEELEADRQFIIDQLDERESEAEDQTDYSIEAIHDVAEAINRYKTELREWGESDDGEEYRKLKAFWEEIEGYGGRDLDLICDSYFERFAQDEAESIHGDVMSQWPFTCIDWEQAIGDLQHDYSSAEFGSTTYWYRS